MKPLSFFFKSICLTSLLVCYTPAVAATKDSSSKDQPPYPSFAVILKSPEYVFETSFTGLAMQPFANNLDYAAEALPFNYGDAQPAISPSWAIPVISTNYHFGFDLKVAGIFRGACSNLMLNWERFHSSNDTDSTQAASINDMVGTFFEIGPDASPYKKGKGRVDFHFDEVNLDYGTFVRFGKHLRMNLFAGVGFGRIVQHYTKTISNFPDTIVRTIDVPSEFMGAGPQLGFDFSSKIHRGFQFVGASRATLFVGTFENSTTFSTSSDALIALGDLNPNIQTTSVENKGGIVPGFEGKLGLAYETCFRTFSMIRIEAGYQAQIYLNAIRSVDMGSEVALGTIGSIGSSVVGVYARTFDRTVSDFALAGPYAMINCGF